MNKRTCGFTLIEVVISITILGLIIALLSYSFTNQAQVYRLKKAVWEIYSRLNYARYKAILRGVKYKVNFDSNSYVVERFDDPKGEWQTEQRSFFNGVVVAANNSPIFHPRGTVSNLASIIVQNSRGKYKISIAISGRIKVVEM
ncbi:MAG: type II secretion system protein [Candidatus Aminicenantes bacterium]|jgi:prepilin-type N-terminal cleavage/methylation domain-containing protein